MNKLDAMSVEERRAYWRARDAARAADKKAQVRRWKLANKQKLMAQREVEYATHRGELKRLPCIVCGEPQTVGHHASYDPQDRLSVTWLCRSHHAQVHAEHKAYGEVLYR